MQLLEIKTWWNSGVHDFSARPPRPGPFRVHDFSARPPLPGPFRRQYTVLLTKLTQSPNPKNSELSKSTDMASKRFVQKQFGYENTWRQKWLRQNSRAEKTHSRFKRHD